MPGFGRQIEAVKGRHYILTRSGRTGRVVGVKAQIPETPAETPPGCRDVNRRSFRHPVSNDATARSRLEMTARGDAIRNCAHQFGHRESCKQAVLIRFRKSHTAKRMVDLSGTSSNPPGSQARTCSAQFRMAHRATSFGISSEANLDWALPFRNRVL